MAVVLPVLLLIFCGIVDFGWIMGNQIIAENGSREGARLGSVVATQSDYQTQISTRVMNITPDYSHVGLHIDTTLTNESDPSKGDVEVKITYTFRLLTPMAQTILGGETYTVTSVCIMKVE